MKPLSQLLTSGTLAAAAVATIGAFVSSAEAATFVSPTVTLAPAVPTPFPAPTTTSAFSLFDSTGKTITAVRAYITATLTGSVTFTNASDGTPRTVNEYTQRGTLRARGPGGVPQIIQIIPQQTIIDPNTPLTLGSGESQGFNFSASAGPVSAVVAPVNWSLFLALGGGSGTVDWSGTASALSDIDNGINVLTAAQLAGTFRFEVDYNELPPPPPPTPIDTPEPATVLGLLAVAGAGAANRRKREY